MDIRHLQKLLLAYKAGSLSIEEVINKLSMLDTTDIGIAKVDNHRAIRQGVPEVIFAQNKKAKEIEKIAKVLNKNNSLVLITRLSKKKVKKIKLPLKYFKKAQIGVLGSFPEVTSKSEILIITAGTSDINVAEEAKITALALGNNVKTIYDVGVSGIHRLLSYQEELRKARVIIVIAGMEGALASVVGGLVNVPVIAVPTSTGYGTAFGGITALLGMLNSCASGVSVVNINNGFGAAYCASLINQNK